MARVQANSARDLARVVQRLGGTAAPVRLAATATQAVCLADVDARHFPVPPAELGCRVVPPVVLSGESVLLTVVGPSSSFSRMLQSFGEWGEIRVESKRNLSAADGVLQEPASQLLRGLTRRQLEILRRAHELGYYSSPKRVNLKGLAAHFAIAPSTLAEHLQKGERAALSAFLSVVGTDAPSRALRGLGRPPRRP